CEHHHVLRGDPQGASERARRVDTLRAALPLDLQNAVARAPDARSRRLPAELVKSLQHRAECRRIDHDFVSIGSHVRLLSSVSSPPVALDAACPTAWATSTRVTSWGPRLRSVESASDFWVGQRSFKTRVGSTKKRHCDASSGSSRSASC